MYDLKYTFSNGTTINVGGHFQVTGRKWSATWNYWCQPHHKPQNYFGCKLSSLAIRILCLFTGCQFLFVAVTGSSKSGWEAWQKCCKSQWHLRFSKLTVEYQENAVVHCMEFWSEDTLIENPPLVTVLTNGIF